MTTLFLRRAAFTLAAVTWAFLASGCILSDGGPGYGYDGGGAVGVGYYEDYGVDYGGWGPGYQVAPFRGDDHRHDGGEHRPDGGHRPEGGGRPGGHSYHPAPASRSMPSLPSRGNPGGSRGGSQRR